MIEEKVIMVLLETGIRWAWDWVCCLLAFAGGTMLTIFCIGYYLRFAWKNIFKPWR